jgi:hypothetical protein
LSSNQADPPPKAISAVMVALDMIQTHKHTKSWSLEIVLITDGKWQASTDTPSSADPDPR